MPKKIQQISDSLLAHAKSNKTGVKELKNKSLKHALKDKSLNDSKGITEAMFHKSRRLAAMELMRDNLQTLIDTKKWTDEVKALFPDATFRINARKGQMIIEVNI